MGVEEEALLQSLGLTKNESLVYLALCSLGPAGASDIAEKSSVQRTLVYDTLKRLVERGFVSQVDINGKKLFKAAEPSRLSVVVEEQQKRVMDNVSKLLPMLESGYSNDKRPSVSMYTGIEGLKTILTDEINSTQEGGEIMAYRAQPELASVASIFISWWHKKRLGKKITFKAILDTRQESANRGKELEKLGLVEVRYLQTTFPTPVTYHVFGDKVALMSVTPSDTLGVIIESKVFAASFKDNFEYIWLKLGEAKA